MSDVGFRFSLPMKQLQRISAHRHSLTFSLREDVRLAANSPQHLRRACGGHNPFHALHLSNNFAFAGAVRESQHSPAIFIFLKASVS